MTLGVGNHFLFLILFSYVFLNLVSLLWTKHFTDYVVNYAHGLSSFRKIKNIESQNLGFPTFQLFQMNKKGGVMDEKNNMSHFSEGSEKTNDLPFEWLGLTSRKESNLHFT